MSERFLEVAAGIGERLVDEAIRTDGRCLWLGDALVPIDGDWQVVHRSFDGDVYSGSSGTAWFLAQLARLTGDRAQRDTALSGLAHALDWAEGPGRDLPPSLYSGSLGPATIGVRVGALLDDSELADRAARLGRIELRRAVAGTDAESDLIAGTAGAIVAAVALHDTTGDSTFLEHGSDLADAVVERARPMFVGRAWASPHGEAMGEAPLCGLGHGASGIALALDELGDRTGDTRWADTSADAVRYERSLFDRSQENWPDLREFRREDLVAGGSPAFPAFWCHGAVGIGLARFRRWELAGDQAALAEAASATQRVIELVRSRTTAYAHDYEHNFSICHGFAGCVELLLCAAEHGDERTRHAAELVGDFGLEHCVGSPAGWPCGVRDGGETPSLMLGTAGIGLCYLRLFDDRATAPTWWLATPGRNVSTAGDRTVGPVSISERRPRVIVQLAMSDAGAESVAESLASGVSDARVIRVSRRGRAVLELAFDADVSAVAADLDADPRVDYAEPDVVDTAQPPGL